MFSYQILFSGNSKNIDEISNNTNLGFKKNDRMLFDHWMDVKKIDKDIRNTNVSDISSFFTSQVIQFNERDKLNFTIFFPDGAKAEVVARDWPDRFELSVHTSNIRLNQKLKKARKKTERQLEDYFSKPIFLHILDNY